MCLKTRQRISNSVSDELEGNFGLFITVLRDQQVLFYKLCRGLSRASRLRSLSWRTGVLTGLKPLDSTRPGLHAKQIQPKPLQEILE